MKNKKIIGIIVAIVIVAIVGLVVFLIMNNNNEAKLRQEAEKIGKTDLLTEQLDMDIKTKDEYGVVEQTMKEYINEYSKCLKEIETIINDEKMQTLISIENYKNDGPEFNESTKYLTTAKENFNKAIEKIVLLTNEDEMINRIQDKNLKEEYVKLYKELMIGDGIANDLSQTVATINETKGLVNNIFSIQESIINFLKESAGNWQINDQNIIEFNNEELTNKYNSFLDELSGGNNQQEDITGEVDNQQLEE